MTGFTKFEQAIATRIEGIANLPVGSIQDGDGLIKVCDRFGEAFQRFECETNLWGLALIAHEYNLRLPELTAAIAAEEGEDEIAPREEYPGEVTDPWDSDTNRAMRAEAGAK